MVWFACGVIGGLVGFLVTFVGSLVRWLAHVIWTGCLVSFSVVAMLITVGIFLSMIIAHHHDAEMMKMNCPEDGEGDGCARHCDGHPAEQHDSALRPGGDDEDE